MEENSSNSAISTMGSRTTFLDAMIFHKGKLPEKSSHSSAILTMESSLSSRFEVRSSNPKKINHHETKDRISQLPDSILQHILSLLPMEDVIKTSVLCKRWISIWTGVPTLDFRYRRKRYTGKSLYKFLSFVNKTLRLYTGHNKLIKLIISLPYTRPLLSNVDNWIRFVSERNVEEFFLDCLGGGMHLSDGYKLPQSFLFNSSFRILDTKMCHVCIPNHCVSVSWTSLKVLSIGYTYLYSHVIEKILLGCPILECLKLIHCTVFSKFTIRSSSLMELVVDTVAVNDGMQNTGILMEISAPNVCSLSLLGCMDRIMFKLINDMPSLVEANLSFRMRADFIQRTIDCYECFCNMLKELLMQSHVAKLTIGKWCIQVLSLSEMQSLPSSLSTRKSLILNGDIKEWDLPGIANLLHSSPLLEKLTINMMPLGYTVLEGNSRLFSDSDPSFLYIDGMKYWTSTERNFECLSCHLKIVEINFKFLRYHIDDLSMRGKLSKVDPTSLRLNSLCWLVEFLLKNAKVLEKMVLYVEADDFGQLGMSTEIEKKKFWDCSELNQFILSYIQECLRMLWLRLDPNFRSKLFLF